MHKNKFESIYFHSLIPVTSRIGGGTTLGARSRGGGTTRGPATLMLTVRF